MKENLRIVITVFIRLALTLGTAYIISNIFGIDESISCLILTILLFISALYENLKIYRNAKLMLQICENVKSHHDLLNNKIEKIQNIINELNNIIDKNKKYDDIQYTVNIYNIQKDLQYILIKLQRLKN